MPTSGIKKEVKKGKKNKLSVVMDDDTVVYNNREAFA